VRMKGFVAALLVLVSPIIGGKDWFSTAHQPMGHQLQDGTPMAVGRAEAPAWEFALLTFQDPYRGTLQQPAKPRTGVRYVGAEVQITNGSDQALAFFSSDVKLNENTGLEFRAGDTLGSEPRLRGRNLNPGERARGWVWFELPEGAKLTRITFVAPGPEFRIKLPALAGA
jgi:hypothetical protein